MEWMDGYAWKKCLIVKKITLQCEKMPNFIYPKYNLIVFCSEMWDSLFCWSVSILLLRPRDDVIINQ